MADTYSRTCDAIARATREATRIDYPRRVYTIPSGPLPIRKGRPGFLHSTPFAYRREHFRSISRGRVKKTAHHPLYLTPFTMEELKKFIGILIYSGEYHVSDLRQFWNRRKSHEAMHSMIQLAMSLRRFQVMYKSFRFTEEQVCNLYK